MENLSLHYIHPFGQQILVVFLGIGNGQEPNREKKRKEKSCPCGYGTNNMGTQM